MNSNHNGNANSGRRQNSFHNNHNYASNFPSLAESNRYSYVHQKSNAPSHNGGLPPDTISQLCQAIQNLNKQNSQIIEGFQSFQLNLHGNSNKSQASGSNFQNFTNPKNFNQTQGFSQ